VSGAAVPSGIRVAVPADLAAINAIYNHYVLHSTATYQTEPETLADRERWFAAHGPAHPVTVAEVDGQVVGWGSLSRFHPRAAFDRTVEDSIYIHHQHHGHGLGRALLADLVTRARAGSHRVIVAAISADQEPSLRLHARAGFVETGRLREVGFKFGRWLDVAYLQLVLETAG
jgi:phosphinothricin acetyltransferase